MWFNVDQCLKCFAIFFIVETIEMCGEFHLILRSQAAVGCSSSSHIDRNLLIWCSLETQQVWKQMPSLQNPFLIVGGRVSFAMRCLLQLICKFISQQTTDYVLVIEKYFKNSVIHKENDSPVSPALPGLHWMKTPVRDRGSTMQIYTSLDYCMLTSTCGKERACLTFSLCKLAIF